MTKSRKSVGAAMLIALSVVGATSTLASARSVYDGVWSVVVAAEAGTCSGSYRYPIAIVDGHVRHAEAGKQLFSIRGRVAAGGRVTVEVSRGDLRAYGLGRLSRLTGGGTWRSPNGCAGHWEAARRV
jgi:hypothetical protein